MPEQDTKARQDIAPESTAARVALWRAMHLMVDKKPYIVEDEIGFKLLAPAEGWRNRPDMDVDGTSLLRASICARARFIDDLVIDQAASGVGQYVILGAGLDSFAQRRGNLDGKLKIFEVDQLGPQEWKKQRLQELGYGLPEWLHFVPVNFEAGDSWMEKLKNVGFDPNQRTVVSSTGVTLYLTSDAVVATLREIAKLESGSTLAMTYILPMDCADAEELPAREASERGARASGTPFVSYYRSEEMIQMALDAGFKTARHVTAAEHNAKYFANRQDYFHASKSEEMLVATT